MPLNLNVDWSKYPQQQDTTNQGVNTPRAKASLMAPMMFSAMGDMADGITTQMALHRGGAERNPLYPQGKVGNAMMQGGMDLAKMYAAKKLNDSGHDKLAKALLYTTGGIGMASAMHNLQSYRRMK